ADWRPAPRPWRMRKKTKRAVAKVPTCAYVGSTSMRTDDAALSRSVSNGKRGCPSRSPSRPIRTPPTGRAKKPIAKVASDDSVATTGSFVGKNTAGRTSAEAVPYNEKSYHSRAVPTVDASVGSLVRVRGIAEPFQSLTGRHARSLVRRSANFVLL